jgi:phosphatidylglycerophosphate synthase
MVTTRYKPFFDALLKPLAAALGRRGISPSAITLAGLFLNAVICLAFLSTYAVVPFCLAIIAVGGLDGLDGAVARVSGRVTKFGAYLDAMCDRAAEAIVILSVAQVTGYWALTMTVLVGSLLVSYAKARAAIEVAVSNLEWPDLMERPERGLLFIIGLALGYLVPWRPLGRDLFLWTLMLLVVLVYVTVVQRILRARRFILTRGSA